MKNCGLKINTYTLHQCDSLQTDHTPYLIYQVFFVVFFYCNMFIQYQQLTSTVYSGHSSFLFQEISDIVLSIQFIANVYINSANLARTFPVLGFSITSPGYALSNAFLRHSFQGPEIRIVKYPAH